MDLVAMCPEEGVTRLLQVTSGSGLSARVKKITTERADNARVACSMPGLAVECWGWRKLKGKGRKQWFAKRVRIHYEDGQFRIEQLEDF